MEAMNHPITMRYDEALRAYLISMPDYVSLADIEDLQNRLFSSFISLKEGQCALLIDTNKHDFESIACLKALRDLLESPPVSSNCIRVAFVQPRQYREAQIVSDQEAYFYDKTEAYSWLESMATG